VAHALALAASCLSQEGVPYNKIAPEVRDGLSVPTLMKHFKDELVPAKSGKKPFGPTDDERRLVEMLAAQGLRYVDIASVLRGGISCNALWKYFHVEIRRGG